MGKKYVLLAILSTFLSNSYACSCREYPTGYLECVGKTNADLPITDCAGFYYRIVIYGNIFTEIPAHSFPGMETDMLMINDNPELLSISPKFWDGSERLVIYFGLNGNTKLKTFPFEDFQHFTNVERVEMQANGLEMIPGNTTWSSKLREINLNSGLELKLIQSHSFSMATGLTKLTINGANENIVVESNGFHTTSTHYKSLEFQGDYGKALQANAYGNVDGGQLWDEMKITTLDDYPEDVYRLLLKSHFDKGHTSLFTGGATRVISCDSCDIAWLYKDARKFNLNSYISLVGESNVMCPNGPYGYGPVLESNNPEFIALMNSCPDTPMPWPGPNYCEDITDEQNTTEDPDSCSCFYHCSGQMVMGHECCAPGLVYNPVLSNCDWPYNVPECQV